MKRFTATYWRSNPQLANGGYETKREIEARTIKSAEKKAQEIARKTAYGGMQLISVQPA